MTLPLVICPVCNKVVEECTHFNHEEEDYDPPSDLPLILEDVDED
jgi:hypothetical protein